MYRFPLNLDLSRMVGSDLNQMRLGRYDVQFVFDSDVTIAVQSRITVLENDEPIADWNSERNWSNLNFQKIVNATVAGCSVLDEQTLEIRFSENFAIQLFDDSDQYESMQIWFKCDGQGPIII
jgi:hypothetical protein